MKLYSVNFDICVDDLDLLDDPNSYYKIQRAALTEFSRRTGLAAVIVGSVTDNCFLGQIKGLVSVEDIISLYDWVTKNSAVIDGTVFSDKYPVYFSDFTATEMTGSGKPIPLSIGQWEDNIFPDISADEVLLTEARYEQRSGIMTRRMSKARRREMARRLAAARRAARRKAERRARDIDATDLRKRIAKLRARLDEMEVEERSAGRKKTSETVKRATKLAAAEDRVKVLRRLLRRAEKEYKELRQNGAEIVDKRRAALRKRRLEQKKAEIRRRKMLAALRARRKAFSARKADAENEAPRMIRRKRDGKLFLRTDI